MGAWHFPNCSNNMSTIPMELQGKEEEPLLQTCMVCNMHIALAGTSGHRPVLPRSEKQSLQTCVQKDVRQVSSKHFLFYDGLKFSVCFF